MKHHYFKELNYTLGNEDLAVEKFVLQKEFTNKNINICSIAGSGNRSVPLLSTNINKIIYCDTSKSQLALTELRTQAIKFLTYDQFLSFLGYTTLTPPKRKALYNIIQMTTSTKRCMEEIFKKHNWTEVIYIGKWEKTFHKISNLINLLVGKKIQTLINIQNKDDYLLFLKKSFPKKRWALATFLLGNAIIFNKLLYKGKFPKNNTSQSMYSFYKNAFYKIFYQDIARKNFFLNILISGKIKHKEAFPIECNKKLYTQSQQNIKNTKIIYKHNHLLKEVCNYKNHFDYIVLSDAPSYFKSPEEQNFIQTLRKSITSNGIIIMRFYLYTPQNIDYSGFKDITKKYSAVISQEKVGMYQIKIIQKI